MMVWGVLGNFKRAQFVVKLWMTGNETEQSFVRRQSTKPFSLVFSNGNLLPLFPCSRDDLVRDFIHSND